MPWEQKSLTNRPHDLNPTSVKSFCSVRHKCLVSNNLDFLTNTFKEHFVNICIFFIGEHKCSGKSLTKIINNIIVCNSKPCVPSIDITLHPKFLSFIRWNLSWQQCKNHFYPEHQLFQPVFLKYNWIFFVWHNCFLVSKDI